MSEKAIVMTALVKVQRALIEASKHPDVEIGPPSSLLIAVAAEIHKIVWEMSR